MSEHDIGGVLIAAASVATIILAIVGIWRARDRYVARRIASELDQRGLPRAEDREWPDRESRSLLEWARSEHRALTSLAAGQSLLESRLSAILHRIDTLDQRLDNLDVRLARGDRPSG